MEKLGKMFLITGPSGVGKKTLMTRLFNDPSLNLVFSISYTTRTIREGEKDGVDYFFTTVEEFKRKVEQGLMLEHAHFFNNYYGTSKEFVDGKRKLGQNVVVEIETMGFDQVREKTDDFVSIFIMPPSFEELKKRLMIRGTETEAEIDLRLEKAKKEVEVAKLFHYVVVNDDLEKAVKELDSIFRSEIFGTDGGK